MILQFLFEILSPPQGASYAGVPILAIVAAAASIYQLGKGISQDAKAKKLEKGLVRPNYNPQEYKIPEEVDQYLNRTKMRALDQKLPGQSAMEDRIGRSTANATAATQQSGGSSAEILNSIASIQSAENRTMQDLNAMAAQNNMIKQQEVDAALLQSAGYKDKKFSVDNQMFDKKFQVNEYDPYKEKAAAISALKGASQQNVYGGIEGIGSVAMTQMQYGEGETEEEKAARAQRKTDRQNQRNARRALRGGAGGGGYAYEDDINSQDAASAYSYMSPSYYDSIYG